MYNTYAFDAVRMRRGLSLDELAERAELDYVTIWNLRRGKTKKPWLRTVFQLARALEIHPSFVMRDVETLTPEERKGLDLL